MNISDISKQYYLNKLISSVFKIIPMYEEHGYDSVKIYLGGLLMDVASADSLFGGRLSPVLIKLNIIYECEIQYKDIRRKVFECTNLIQTLIEDIGDKDERNK